MTSATLTSPGQHGCLGAFSILTGVSEAAEHLASELKQMVLDKVRTASGQATILPAHAALSSGYAEAEKLVNHGDQALPTPAAMCEANELLAALPQWCDAPSPIIEPSGAIAFEWDRGPNRWLVLALKGTGTIEHSAMLGLGNEQSGTRNYAGALGRHELALLSELMHLRD